VLCIFWLLAEPVRLAAGWYGNLQENVRRRTHQDKPALVATHAAVFSIAWCRQQQQQQ
jgi:hypothetical protein